MTFTTLSASTHAAWISDHSQGEAMASSVLYTSAASSMPTRPWCRITKPIASRYGTHSS